MTNKSVFLNLAACCSLLLTGACAPEKAENPEPYAFYQAVGYQVEDDGKTGMMNLEGEKICDPQFEGDVTFASCDRFFVRGEDNLWRLYTLEAQPRQVGEDAYFDVGAFVDGLCPVAKPNSWPVYIDTAGHTVIDMKEYEGKRIDYAFNFQDGLARVMTEDTLYGFIDTRGTMVVEPRYAKAQDFYYGLTIVRKPQQPGEDSQEWAVIDKTGNEIFSTSTDRYSPELTGFEKNGQTVVSMKDGKKYLLLDSLGKKGPTLKAEGIKSMWGDYILYYDEDFYDGLMNTKGEVVVEPDYKDITWRGGPLVAETGREDEYIVLNKRGEELNTLNGHKVWAPDYRFIGFTNSILCYGDSGGYWADSTGRKKVGDIPYIATGTGEEMNIAQTDYESIQRFLEKVSLTNRGLMGLNVECKAADLDFSHPFIDFDSEEEKDKQMEFSGSFRSVKYELTINFDKKFRNSDGDRIEGATVSGIIAGFRKTDDPEGAELYEAVKTEIGRTATYRNELKSKNFDKMEYFTDDNSNYITLVKNGRDVGILYGFLYFMYACLAD